jgi:hypothetical protein
MAWKTRPIPAHDGDHCGVPGQVDVHAASRGFPEGLATPRIVAPEAVQRQVGEELTER